MKKAIIILVILTSLLIFGCTEQGPVCGDNTCEDGEEFTCSLDCGNEKIEEVSKIMSWTNAEPFGILDWSINQEGLMSLVIINNSSFDLNFKSIKINQNNFNFESEYTGVVESEEFILIDVLVENNLSREGFSVFIEKENISIEYAPIGASNTIQNGAADIKIVN